VAFVAAVLGEIGELPAHDQRTIVDEGMINGSSIFAYLVFRSREGLSLKALEAHQGSGLVWPRS
jgi:hypothetical protein